MSLPEGGPPEWVAMYYDPIIDHIQRGGAHAAIADALLLAPQEPATARRFYEWAVTAFGWDDPARELFNPRGDPHLIPFGLVLSREFGDGAVYERLHAFAEATLEPTWDRARGEFWYGFGLDEPHPRGQPNAVIMMAEAMSEGDWWRVFNEPNLRKLDQPTVVGVDYPTLGIAQAFCDAGRDRLAVATYAADPAAAGQATRFRVERLHGTDGIRVERDGRPFDGWRATGADTIEVAAEAADHAYLILGAHP